MDLKTLDTLTDPDLQAVIAHSTELLATRDRQRKDDALAKASAMLESVGLSLKDLPRSKPKQIKEPSPYKKGHVYRHPDDQKLTFKGGGMVPKWARELPSDKKAVELSS